MYYQIIAYRIRICPPIKGQPYRWYVAVINASRKEHAIKAARTIRGVRSNDYLVVVSISRSYKNVLAGWSRNMKQQCSYSPTGTGLI